MPAAQPVPLSKPEWIVFEMPEMLQRGELLSQWANVPGQPSAGAELLAAGWQAIRDLEDTKKVSASLFPRNLPSLAGVDYAGVCIEARQAGGDFYDFFDRGPHRLGLAVGDVSGKGVASAMVRATVQGSLRTMELMGVDDLESSLALANRIVLESTPETMYASLFLAEYDGRSETLKYANCGHPAPLLVRGGEILTLKPTSTVVGLFSGLRASVVEVPFSPGDTLLLYTDGVTEARNDDDEEFGEERLLTAVKGRIKLPVSCLLQGCLDDVRAFSPGNLCDDLTLVAVRGLPPQV